jgi:mannose-1-phosphate guanylyltransferase/mannose-1-phosphate guanylyltransferase/mannose-6-phosphate isomerase
MNHSQVFFGILSGGAGTRLWPLSRKNFPKQFSNFSSQDPLLIETIKRVESLGSISILTTKDLKTQTQGLLNRFSINAEIISEPSPQNTAPIIALFNELCFRKNKNSVICILPADHAISPVQNFRADIQKALKTAENKKIVTLGIPPRDPSTAYGYLETKSTGSELSVKKFTEKPNLEKAQALIKNSALWNAGMFIFHAETFKETLQKYAPQIFDEIEKLKTDLSNLEEVYSKLPSISIDYAVMEKLSDIQCVKASFNWSDLGSWEEIVSKEKAPHKISQINSHKNHYTGTHKIPKTIAFVGVDNLIAVDTPDSLLILKEGAGQEVKALVEELKKTNPKITESHAFEERPWGRFEILLDTPVFKSKLITVWPGQRLSYQSHNHRREHWIIVEGEGEFTLNGEIRAVKSGDYLFIPLGAKHRIANNSQAKLEFVEVQQGTYFGEDDIIRYDDDYGRN